MPTLGLVPSEGLRVEESSPSNNSSNTEPPSEASNEPTSQAQAQRTNEFQVWYGVWRHTPSPFVATIEPVDRTPEKRTQNILRQKSLLLAAKLFPGVDSSDDLGVEFVGSGTFHNVVSFTVPTLNAASQCANTEAEQRNSVSIKDKYVVRVPQPNVTDPEVDQRRNIAILRGLAGKISVPIPRVVHFDLSVHNILDSPYTIETYIPGRTLEYLVSNGTNDAQNRHIFEQSIRLVETLASTTSPYAGWITDEYVPGVHPQDHPSQILVRTFDFPFDTNVLILPQYHSPLAFMLKAADLWIEHEHAHHPSEDNFITWTKLKAIIHSLHRRDFLGTTFHLCHGDLAARNILGAVTSRSTVDITGVVDWDFACFAPAFCAFKPPLDMWGRSEDVAAGRCTAELVNEFKAVASEEYAKYALSVEARLANKIWYTLRMGMLDEDMRWYATNLIWKWEHLHPEDEIGKIWS